MPTPRQGHAASTRPPQPATPAIQIAPATWQAGCASARGHGSCAQVAAITEARCCVGVVRRVVRFRIHTRAVVQDRGHAIRRDDDRRLADAPDVAQMRNPNTTAAHTAAKATLCGTP